MYTKDWKSIEKPEVLLIGHDPRLNKSNTIADYALFADYYFRPKPLKGSEVSKYGLAESTFNYISILTNNKIKPEQVYITNLCNNSLPHAPKNKTVLIPEAEAIEGLRNINSILTENPTIKYIFPMSLQVNYWLQKLNLYNSNDLFLDDSEPLIKGITSNPAYFQAKKGRTFLMICGNQYRINGGNQIVIPILHTKCFPLKDNFLAYTDNYKRITACF